MPGEGYIECSRVSCIKVVLRHLGGRLWLSDMELLEQERLIRAYLDLALALQHCTTLVAGKHCCLFSPNR